MQIPLGRPIRVRSLVVERRLDMAKVASSILAEPTKQFDSLTVCAYSSVVEHWSDKPAVGGSTPPARTRNKCQCSSAVEHALDKRDVASSSLAIDTSNTCFGSIAQLGERRTHKP